MQKSKAPFVAPAGRKWCSMHNVGRGAYLPTSEFPENYSYCRECKRAYQREWDKNKRVRPDVIVVPNARLSRSGKKIFVTLPNTEKARNGLRTLFSYWPDTELDW